MTRDGEAQWVTDYGRACWQVWSPGDLTRIGRKRRKRGYTLDLDCDTMTIDASGPITEGAWRWRSEGDEAVEFLDSWIEYGGDHTRFQDWMLGHLWCIFDMPREMPPFPKEFYEVARNGR